MGKTDFEKQIHGSNPPPAIQQLQETFYAGLFPARSNSLENHVNKIHKNDGILTTVQPGCNPLPETVIANMKK